MRHANRCVGGHACGYAYRDAYRRVYACVAAEEQSLSSVVVAVRQRVSRAEATRCKRVVLCQPSILLRPRHHAFRLDIGPRYICRHAETDVPSGQRHRQRAIGCNAHAVRRDLSSAEGPAAACHRTSHPTVPNIPSVVRSHRSSTGRGCRG